MRAQALTGLAALSLVVLVAPLALHVVQGTLGGSSATVPLQASQPSGEVAFLEAVVVHTDLTPLPATNANDTTLRCAPSRTLETTYRPVMLLSNETGCGFHERVELTLHLDLPRRYELLDGVVAICHVQHYKAITVPSGEKLSGMEIPGCTNLTISTSPRGAPVLQAVVEAPHVADQPGLYLACATAAVAYDHGSGDVLEDLTWFEVWEEEPLPGRKAFRQSIEHDARCHEVGAPYRAHFVVG